MSEYMERIAASRSPLWREGRAILHRLDVELTERCNNNCIHCWVNLPADDVAARSREMPAVEIKRILREAVDCGCLEVAFTGGEPLLREDFEDLYVYARRLGLIVRLSTNARLVTPRLADLFAHMPPLAEIEISVYGMKAETYESVTRAAGSYEQFCYGLNLLLDRKVRFFVSGALLPQTSSEIEEFESWASALPGMNGPPVFSMFFDLRKRRDDADKSRQIHLLRPSPETALRIFSRRPEKEQRLWREFCLQRMKPSGNRLFSCGAGRGGCLNAYGHYQACLSLCAPGWTYDLRRIRLRDAWSALNSRIQNARSANPGYLNRCGRCYIRPLCEQCPAKSWIENETLDTPIEYLCRIAHVRASASGFVRPGEKAWNIANWEERIERLTREIVRS
jgi:radical SAM protein with 4Fe4S-binding SPASM domain